MAAIPKPADRVERHGPRKQEGDLEIEDDEQDRDEVVANVEPHARVFERLEAALVGGKLVLRLSGRCRRAKPSAEKDNADRTGDDEEDQNRCVVCEHSPYGSNSARIVAAGSARGSDFSGRVLGGAHGRTRTDTAFATTPSR